MEKVRNNLRDLWGYLRNWFWFSGVFILKKDVVWVDQSDGSEIVEHWTRRQMWGPLRPRLWGFMTKLPCGCSRRMGRIALYNMNCEKHSGLPRIVKHIETEEEP